MSSRLQISKAVLSMQFMPNSPINGTNVESVIDWFEVVLADLPYETLEAAVRQYVGTETFFPTPGKIREIAMDLQMLAMGVPAPAEAWGMVLTAERHVPSQWCEVGAHLREVGASGGNLDRNKYFAHMDECQICTLGGLKEVYDHPVVAETVKVLGGRDVIITDNPTADRARFIDAYREIVARERTKTAMLPAVKGYLENKQRSLVDGSIKQLTKGLSK